MIVVTGATGQLGRAIVEHLVRRRSPQTIGVSVRDLSKAHGLVELGVRVRAGDFDDPAQLRRAFEGAHQVLIVSSNARAYGGDPLAQHAAAVEAARAVGAERVVYTSHMAVSDRSAFAPMRDHFATERLLERSGIAWTALRNGFYAASGLALMGDVRTTGRIEAPADGRVAWTAHADLAEAAAVILTRERSVDGPTPPLVAADTFDLADLAQIASDHLGREVQRVTLADDAMRSRMIGRGVPERVVEVAMGLYYASRAGEFAAVDATLEGLIGRPPTSMRAVIADHLR